MLAIHPEYVVDEKQHRKSVILPLSDWNRVVDELEELSDIKAYDKAKSGTQDSLPFADAVHEIQAEYNA